MIAQGETELFRAAAEAIAEALNSVPNGRPIHWMLTGGPTAKGVYEALSERPETLPQERLYLYFGDERCVPPDHPASNYGMARDTLLGTLDVHGDQIHRLRGESDPEEASLEAERQLRESMEVGAPDVPALDLLLLGIGADGHVASLFPRAPALAERRRLFVPAENPDGYPRVTATLPLLLAARRIILFGHGAELAPAVHRALDEAPSRDVPASLVCSDAGAINFFFDEAAAAELAPATRARIFASRLAA